MIDPVVADPVTELLLLSPENLTGKVGIIRDVESFPERELLHPGAGHLAGWLQGHGVVHELSVQEGNPGLQAPGHRGLVGSEAVELVEVLHLPHRLPVQLLGAGGLVEVEVTSEDLVRALPAQHHLHPGGLDSPGQEEHRRAGPHRGHVEGLKVVDD